MRRGKLVPMHVSPTTNFPKEIAYQQSHNWTWAILNASARARVWQLTRCDAVLYAEAVRLSQSSLVGTCIPQDPDHKIADAEDPKV